MDCILALCSKDGLCERLVDICTLVGLILNLNQGVEEVYDVVSRSSVDKMAEVIDICKSGKEG